MTLSPTFHPRLKVNLSLNRCLVAALFLLAAPTSALAQDSSNDTADPGLKVGDVVRITVWRRDELSGDFEVAEDGSLIHPLYRQVTVTGIPADQVRARIDQFLETLEADPQFVVQLLERVAILGAVGRPAIYDLRPEMTVSEAIAEAGGVTSNGQADEVQLIRAGSVTIVDLTKPKSAGANMPVQSGDQIIVEEEREGVLRRVILPVLTAVGSIASIINIATQ